jgi:hypothetical protein
VGLIGKAELLCHIRRAFARCKASLRGTNPSVQMIRVGWNANRTREFACQKKAVNLCRGCELRKRDVTVKMFRQIFDRSPDRLRVPEARNWGSGRLHVPGEEQVQSREKALLAFQFCRLTRESRMRSPQLLGKLAIVNYDW